ncbi:response regulator transcription factor [Luteolibacter marinus]|uniref:response regulator transcription factor n=1 Tax=Luteolibacter marinus TaxID=2776705 RepID=UPI001868C28C|nr:response regulator transcription factor [Luteolibacter marinus]
MTKLRLILADDHPVYRQGLRMILESAGDLEIVAEAGDGEEAVALVRQHQPDVLLLDVSMPKLDGIGVARCCRDEKLGTRLVFLTMHQEEQLLQTALQFGVRGYVLKESIAAEIVEAVRAVARGDEYLSPPLAALLMKRARARFDFQRETPGLTALTGAERRILRLIASDRTSKEIANDLGLSVRTVENHRSRAAQKLGLSGAHSLVKFAFEHRDEI